MNELIGRTNRSIDGCDLLDGLFVLGCPSSLFYGFWQLLSLRQREKNQRLILGVTSSCRLPPVTAPADHFFEIEIINLTLESFNDQN